MTAPGSRPGQRGFGGLRSRIFQSLTGAATAGQVLTSNGANALPAFKAFIPSGTLMLFQQTAAPTGWTKQTTHNDKALRVVSGTASSGGTSAFSTVFGKTATDTYTLATADIPAHTHNLNTENFGPGSGWQLVTSGSAADQQTGSAGGGGSHSHGMDIRVQYVDLIIASKD